MNLQRVAQRNVDGKPLRMVGRPTDMSAQKIATRTLETALRDSSALLHALNMHAIVSIADAAGKIIEVNDAFCNISGYSREELLGKNHRIVKSNVQPRQFWVDMWNDISNGKPWRNQVCNRAKDGTHYWVDTFIAPFMNLDGSIEKYVSIRTDITAAKQNEEVLRNDKKAADAASNAKSEFLANMSHELRTPMNAILGMLTLLKKTELNHRQADYAQKTEGAARYLLGLLNDILDLSKAEAGKMSLDPHPFFLANVLRDISVILSTLLGKKPVDIRFDIPADTQIEMVGDAMRLQQTLLNLSSNAIKFTEQGSVILKIDVLHKSESAMTLKFSVSDTGIGIAPENQARIFSGFTQAETSTTRRYGGTGLGLAISQRLINLMGGQLELSSTLGEGSCFFFTITLPLALNSFSSHQKIHLRHDTSKVSHEPRLLGMKILLAEDNLINQQIAQELLEFEGAIVVVANNGQEAVAKVAQWSKFDVVLMDLQMPVMDGFAATKSIRNELGHIDLPIVAITANAMPSDKMACLEAGMNDHVAKPFDIHHLVYVLRLRVGWVVAEAAPALTPATVDSDAKYSELPANLPPFDIQLALLRTNGNVNLLKKLIRDFHHSYRFVGAELRHLIDSGKTAEAERLAHTLKGIAAHFEARLLTQAAFVVEESLRENKYDEARKLITALEAALEPAIVAAATLERPTTQSEQDATLRQGEVTSKVSIEPLFGSKELEALNLAIDELQILLNQNSLKASRKFLEIKNSLLLDGALAETSELEELLERLDYIGARSVLVRLREYLKMNTKNE